MAHQKLADALLDDYTQQMLSNHMFRSCEVKRFKKLEADLKNMTFEQRCASADVVARGVCSVSPEFADSFCRSQLTCFMKETMGKINATSICNLAFTISQLKDEKLKKIALKLYDQMCASYIK